MLEDHQAPKPTRLYLLHACKLPNVLQPVPVQRDLIVDLVRLVSNTVKVRVLLVDLLAHGMSNSADILGTAMQCLPGKR